MKSEYYIEVETPEYIMFSSDFSQQEPKLTAAISQDPNMIKAFKEGKDIYAFIAAIAFGKTYEECLEFHPQTKEYQPDGKARRTEAKSVVLGICYGRSVPSIGEQLYSHDDNMTDEEKTKKAQFVYDSVLKAFPNLEKLMHQSQAFAHKHGYVETILGRRRHLPDMMLEEFEFEPLPGYVNPNIDPLDLSTLSGDSGIPQERKQELKKEFSKYKYYGQIAKRTKQLYNEEHIRVVNNRPKINDARRQCVNCVDSETEILTSCGWKKYDQITTGEEIISYDMLSKSLVKDNIAKIHINYEKDQDVISLKTSSFDAVCTKDHRWVMENFDTKTVRFYTTREILLKTRPRYHILRGAKSSFGKKIEKTAVEWVKSIYDGNVDIESLLNIHPVLANDVIELFKKHYADHGSVKFDSELSANAYQMLGFMGGKVFNIKKEVKTYKKKEDVVKYKCTCPSRELNRTARIDLMKKENLKTDLTWCVTTHTGTWVARRNGKIYITGNSIIQGSAADFTKMALLKVTRDPRWEEYGGKILTVVHDEIVAQAPVDTWEKAAAVLKEDMEASGSFLPFPISCDVTASYRWYGLELPLNYPKPATLDNMTEDEIKWVQFHLVELGFELPVYNDKDGNKPRGDAAHGVSGVYSDEMKHQISKYLIRYNITKDDFIENIERRVEVGDL